MLSGVSFTERNLAESMLTPEEILEMAKSIGVGVHDLLRPASPVYKERKEELLAMDPVNLVNIIASEPTLIKRPIVKTEKGYVIGLDEEKIRELIQT